MKVNKEKIKGWFYRWCPQRPSRFDISTSNLRYIQILPWISSVYAKRIFSMIFVFALLIGALNGFNLHQIVYLDAVGMKIGDVSTQVLSVMFVRSFFLPLLLFTISYIFGKRLNLETEIKPIITYLTLGCFIGNFFGYLAINIFIFNSVYVYSDILFNIFLIILDSLYGSLSSTFTVFFLSFSGIAIASLRNNQTKNQVSTAPHSDSAGSSEEREFE